ncbi:MAG TPA: hypothetical protein VF003_13740 [Pseudonocardiaceae bacterium]
MTEEQRTQSATQRGRSGSVATGDAVRNEAAGVSQSVRDAGDHVAQAALDQAKEVAGQTRQQTESLLQQGRQQLHDQAVFQQQKVALRLTTVADELRELAHNSGSDTVGELTRQGADQLHQFASWLHDREPSDLLEEVRSFARRRPGVFLLGAALAGVVAGRLTGAGVAATRQPDDNRSATPATPPAQQVTSSDSSAAKPASEPTERESRYPDDDYSYSYADRPVTW